MTDQSFHANLHGHPGSVPGANANSEPRTADNRTAVFHLGSDQTFGLSDAQLTAIRTNNGFAGGGAMTRDGQGAGGAGR